MLETLALTTHPLAPWWLRDRGARPVRAGGFAHLPAAGRPTIGLKRLPSWTQACYCPERAFRSRFPSFPRAWNARWGSRSSGPARRRSH